MSDRSASTSESAHLYSPGRSGSCPGRQVGTRSRFRTSSGTRRRSCTPTSCSYILHWDGDDIVLDLIDRHRHDASVTDLAKRAGLAYPTAHREVARLLDADILSERQASSSL
jgi:hypothetical protein